MVARVQLQQLRQDRDEPMRAFLARLRGQASICCFKVQCACGNEVHYSDDMVRDTLIRGIADEEIRLDILGLPKQDMSLEEAVSFIEAKESGKRSANIFHNGNAMAAVAATSSYRRQERGRLLTKSGDNNPPTPPCTHCGKLGHSRTRQDRIRKCPAYNHTCAKCGILLHHESVCRQSRRRATAPSALSPPQDDATAIFHTLCSIDSAMAATSPSITLDHHVFNELHEMWEKRASDPQTLVEVTTQAIPSDAQDLGFHTPFLSPSWKASFPAMADTGCQSCLAGLSLLSNPLMVAFFEKKCCSTGHNEQIELPL